MTTALAVALMAPITFGSLMREQLDPMSLTYPPSPFFTTAMASSYDRKSIDPTLESWWANGDYGQYIRTEENGGRHEYVMADLKGPGAVTRCWSANPTGVVRFYFDGESEASVEGSFADFLTGKLLNRAEPNAYFETRGYDNYWPFPYAKSLKITLETPGTTEHPNVYYHFTYRTYPSGTSVASFPVQTIMGDAMNPPAGPNGKDVQSAGQARPGSSFEQRLNTGGCITEMRLNIDPSYDDRDPYWYRRFALEIYADGYRTVNVPIADFFAAPLKGGTFKTAMTAQEADGTLISHWPITYSKNLRVRVVSLGARSANVKLWMRTTDEAGPWTLHAQWTKVTGMSRPIIDMDSVNIRGTGQYVGTVLHVANSDPGWWGEGDEKVWIDDEKFPSTFGTGTEDYFGFAWSRPEVFTRPFHAQTQGGSPGTFGQTMDVRWHLLDRMPFRKAFRFALERWHWIDTPSDYDLTGFWYGPASGTEAREFDRTEIMPMDVQPPRPEPGAIEGEELVIASKTGGEAEAQGGFNGLSKGTQLWWRSAPVGSEMVLKVPVPADGRYRVLVHVCRATDYGRHHLWMGDVDLGVHDYYAPRLEWINEDWGVMNLKEGTVDVKVQVLERNSQAVSGQMFGLDWIKLVRLD